MYLCLILKEKVCDNGNSTYLYRITQQIIIVNYYGFSQGFDRVYR